MVRGDYLYIMFDTDTAEYPAIDNDFYSDNLILIEDDEYKKEYIGLKTYANSEHSTVISRDSLIRKLEKIGDFAIVSASIPGMPKIENIERNKNLRKMLAAKNMTTYLLIGSYKDCFSYSVERFFLISKPDSLNHNQFMYMLEFYLDNFNQKGFIFKKNNEYKYILKNKEIGTFGISLSLADIEGKYNKYLNSFQGEFIFEGLEIPSTTMGAFFMRLNKIQYIDYPYPKSFNGKKEADTIKERMEKYRSKENLEKIEIANIQPETRDRFLTIPGSSYADKLKTLLTVWKG